MLPIEPTEFLIPGATILVDKPSSWTSFDVVNKVRYSLRRLLGVKKIKVGHAGTLDPLATGLLILCTGKKTKTIDKIQGQQKTYQGTIRLGGTTATYDAESEVEQTYPFAHVDLVAVKEAAATFIGKSLQRPPMFSAIKKDGQRLYRLARQGVDVEVPEREIEIFRFEILSFEAPDIRFEVECSKGTYIRSLAYDMGHKLNSGAHLVRLVRTRIGDYALEHAYNLEDLISRIDQLQV